MKRLTKSSAAITMPEFLEKWIPKGSFLQNVIVLTSGTVFAQGLTILALPVLTRLYSPEDFSLLAVYAAVLGIITVVSCLRYNIAIALPEQDNDAFELLIISLGVGSLVSIVFALVVFFAPEQFSILLNLPELQPFLWMLPVGLWIASVYNALQYWTSRKKRFGIVSRTKVSRALGGLSVQLGFGVLSPSAFGLILGQMLAEGFGIVALIRDFMRRDLKLLKSVSFRRLIKQARRYKQFPIYSVPEALLNTLGSQFPIVMIAAALSGPEAGFLFLAMRILGLPIRLIGTSVSQVFVVEAPTKYREGILSDFTRSTIWALIKLGAPPLLLAALISPLLFPVMFGDEWERAGWLIVWMTPWFIVQFAASPVSIVLQTMGRLRLGMWLQAVGATLRIGCVLIAIEYYPELTSEAFAISGVIFYSLYLSIIYYCVKSSSLEREE